LSEKKLELRNSSQTLLEPSTTADPCLNGISENKISSKKKSFDDEEEVIHEKGDISHPENVGEARDISPERETRIDDEITINPQQVDTADVTATQDTDIVGVRKKRQRKPRFVTHTFASNSSPTQSVFSVASSENHDVTPVEISRESSDIESPASNSTDIRKSQSRRKPFRTQTTKVTTKHIENNVGSNDKTGEVEAFKTTETRLVEQTFDSNVENGKSETPSPLPQPVSINRRGRKRKRFESDLSSSGSGFSASSSRDPSPKRKVE
jgi:hypothetical protein